MSMLDFLDEYASRTFVMKKLIWIKSATLRLLHKRKC